MPWPYVNSRRAMRSVLRALLFVGLIAAGAVALMLLAAGFVAGAIWLAGVLGLQHTMGMDTQTTKNYDSVSGVLPIIVTSFAYSSFFAAIWKHVNCEQPGCPWPGHRHPDHGRPVCRRHYHADVVPERP